MTAVYIGPEADLDAERALFDSIELNFNDHNRDTGDLILPDVNAVNALKIVIGDFLSTDEVPLDTVSYAQELKDKLTDEIVDLHEGRHQEGEPFVLPLEAEEAELVTGALKTFVTERSTHTVQPQSDSDYEWLHDRNATPPQNNHPVSPQGYKLFRDE